jgi:8-oxo-dGDP phosphatase
MTEATAGSAQNSDRAPIGDSEMSWPVVDSVTEYKGGVVAVRRDTLSQPDGGTFERDVIVHPGAVGIVAVDEDGRVLIVTQYRHPARRRLVELPAGLLDKDGEDLVDAAKRELAEEGHVRAEHWSMLVRLMPSPGMSDEVMTIYLATGISVSDVPEGFVAHHEESSMTREWVPLADLVEAVLAGRVTNAALVAGVLATAAIPRGVTT